MHVQRGTQTTHPLDRANRIPNQLTTTTITADLPSRRGADGHRGRQVHVRAAARGRAGGDAARATGPDLRLRGGARALHPPRAPQELHAVRWLGCRWMGAKGATQPGAGTDISLDPPTHTYTQTAPRWSSTARTRCRPYGSSSQTGRTTRTWSSRSVPCVDACTLDGRHLFVSFF